MYTHVFSYNVPTILLGFPLKSLETGVFRFISGVGIRGLGAVEKSLSAGFTKIKSGMKEGAGVLPQAWKAPRNNDRSH